MRLCTGPRRGQPGLGRRRALAWVSRDRRAA